ncbi:MAG: arsenate reductase ArsC [Chromatiaceae bacterium]
MSRKLNVIFVCWGNSCRSQMAEGWARPDTLNPFSAGIEPKPHVDPLAVRVMKEAGVDIAYQETHRVSAFLTHDIDAAILVCDEAADACPTFPPQVKTIRRTFDDPPRLAEGGGEEARLAVYRRVRDEIRAYVAQLPELLGCADPAGPCATA